MCATCRYAFSGAANSIAKRKARWLAGHRSNPTTKWLVGRSAAVGPSTRCGLPASASICSIDGYFRSLVIGSSSQPGHRQTGVADHFAFEAGSEAGLAAKRDQLRAKGLEVTDIVDHGWAKSIYFSDPNGLSLEYCCLVRDLTEDDARMQERGTIPLARLDFKNRPGVDFSRVPPARGKVMA